MACLLTSENNRFRSFQEPLGFTSADSDARVDAVTALHSRYPDVDIKVQHASVQGPDALQELMSGVATLD